jgi:hypothetical protein
MSTGVSMSITQREPICLYRYSDNMGGHLGSSKIWRYGDNRACLSCVNNKSCWEEWNKFHSQKSSHTVSATINSDYYPRKCNNYGRFNDCSEKGSCVNCSSYDVGSALASEKIPVCEHFGDIDCCPSKEQCLVSGYCAEHHRHIDQLLIQQSNLEIKSAYKARKNMLKKLEKHAYLIWESPQSFGQRKVVNWSYIESLRECD